MEARDICRGAAPDSNVERWPTPVAMSDPLDNDYKDELFDNDLVSEYFDVASDVENMCVDDGGSGSFSRG